MINIIRRNLKFILPAIALGIIAVIGWKLTVRPSADQTIPTAHPTQTIIWGTVKDTGNQPMANMIVRVGSDGVTTELQGGFLLSTSVAGQASLSFEDARTGTLYQLANYLNQTVFITRGESIHADFVVEKVAATPTPSALPATTPTLQPVATAAPAVVTPRPTATPVCRRVLFHTVCQPAAVAPSSSPTPTAATPR